MKKRMKNNGVTLIALAITILVLLILMGVTISTIKSNQIFSRANTSKKQTEISEEKSILKTSVLYAQNMDSVGEVTLENLRKGLNKNIENKYSNLEEKDDEKYGKIYKITFKKTENTYIIFKDGTIYVDTELYSNEDDSLNITPSSIPNFKTGSQQEIQLSGGIIERNSRIQVKWKSSNEEVVEIQENELDPKKATIVANSEGRSIIEAEVKVINQNGENIKTKTVTCSVLVRNKNIMIDSINLSAEDLTIDLSSRNITRQIVAKTKENKVIDNTDIKWESLQPEIASVDENGIVKGIANGTAIISAKIDNGIYATTTVNVITTPTGIKLDETNVIIDLSDPESLKLEAILIPSTANRQNTITWRSSDDSKVSVDSSGNITAIANTETNNMVKITATTENGYSADCNVVVITSITDISVTPTSQKMEVNQTVQLTVTVVPSTTTEKVVWTSNNTDVATVNDTGIVTAKGSGNATITVKNSDGTKYDICTISVVSGNYLIGKEMRTFRKSG